MNSTKIPLANCFEIAYQAAQKAAEAILEIYSSNDWDVAWKEDSSPLTKADQSAHKIIEHYLLPTQIPILSEEGKSIAFEERKHWEYFWLVDPLDGTKEFIKRNGEFTVNIALIHFGQPIWGIVLAPVLNKCYYLDGNRNVWLEHNGNKLQLQPKAMALSVNHQRTRVVASKSHLDKETAHFIASLSNPEVVSMGSSLKFMMLAEGLADVYPRFAPTMEWDTAAAHAILKALNWQVIDAHLGTALMYNKECLTNPGFIVK